MSATQQTPKPRHWWVVAPTVPGTVATLYKDEVLCARFEYESDAKRVLNLLLQDDRRLTALEHPATPQVEESK